MLEAITYVGIDAHKKNLAVAVLVGTEATPTTWTVANEPRAVERFRRKLHRLTPGPIACCYEAGPCGYALYRQLHRGRLCCQVIAPSLIPRKPGERIKTDRRDARKLAELHRAGLLTEVRPPHQGGGSGAGSGAGAGRCPGRSAAGAAATWQAAVASGIALRWQELDARTPGVDRASVLGA